MNTRRLLNPKPVGEPYARRCRQVIDACLFACLFLTPLWFGGRHDLGRLLYAGVVAIATVAWVAERTIARRSEQRPTKAYAVLVAAVALLTLQITPLPPAVIEFLSPGLVALTPAWQSSADFPLQFGELRTLSVNPAATRVGLAVLFSHALLFVVTTSRLRDQQDIRRLLFAIGAASAAMAAFGLVQWATSNGRLMWFYTHPQREIGDSVQGAFANKNHFAHFVTLGLGPLLLALHACLKPQTTSRRQRQQSSRSNMPRTVAVSAAALVAVAAVVFSLSRGALAALAIAACFAALVLLLRGGVRPRDGWAVAAVAAGVVLAVSLGDLQTFAHRYGDLTSGSIEQLDQSNGRREVWAANLQALQANPWFGYGAGNHLDVYPAFIETGFPTQFTHAESGYLQTTTAAGLAGAGLLLAAWGLVAIWCSRGIAACRHRSQLFTWVAIVLGLVASLVHSVVDFVWYIPACMAVTVLLAACALRLHQLTMAEGHSQAAASHERSAPFAWVPLGALSLGAAWAVLALSGPGAASLAWDRYQRATVQERHLVSAALRYPESKHASRTDDRAFLKEQMLQALEEVLRHNPSDARARLRLAGRRLQWFEAASHDSPNQMPLLHIRDAALASRFESREQTSEWLRRAWGEPAEQLVAAYHDTRAAVQLAPLQGDAYVLLSKLSFLAPPDERDHDALLSQALQLRPQDPGVLFEAGRHALAAGEVERGIELWRQAHRTPGVDRLHILATCAANYPAQVYLNEFKPDIATLPAVYQQYRRRNEANDLRAIGDYAATLAEESVAKGGTSRWAQQSWLLASQIAAELDDYAESAQRAEHAVRLAPHDFAGRRALAAAYAEAGRFDQAAPHLRWCLSRRPYDKKVQGWLKQARVNRQSVARKPSAKVVK